MERMNEPKGTSGFCIYIDTLFEGTVPAVRDAEGRPCVFASEAEAQREIADNMITRLQEFIDGERGFEDAMTIEEYTVAVRVLSDSSIMDERGKHFYWTSHPAPSPRQGCRR